MVLSPLIALQVYLETKYHAVVKNKSPIIWIVVLVVALMFAYAFYCTSRGYSFTGQIKFSAPFVKIGCRP
ncbi:hypothetical protein [Ligilactobacillus murinus]|uniref:hypothetical protein n=1 Tax=Ligilactobacillus murinus TaxID=1622 RepID=UPI000704A667|nr:hypothetical protein [Ligilactobacillus murinus]